jgi:hypothetical protein
MDATARVQLIIGQLVTANAAKDAQIEELQGLEARLKELQTRVDQLKEKPSAA